MEYTSVPDLIQKFVGALGVSVDVVEKLDTASHCMYNVRTPESNRLIGPQGEHLRAINHLLRRMAERNDAFKEEKFLVDVDGYHYAQVRDIEQKATLLAERVRTFQSSVEMMPMNAYERMIVHTMFSADPEVATASEGLGDARHVVLRYKSTAV